jgi:hypothetical protein
MYGEGDLKSARVLYDSLAPKPLPRQTGPLNLEEARQ